MNFYFLDSGFGAGSHNMEFDQSMAAQCSAGDFFLRLYRWDPFCISLGANQDFGIIDYELTERDDIDVVKRPTGGRAILHSEELTYSVALRLTNGYTPHTVYREINSALQKGLKIYNSILAEASLEKLQPDFAKIYKNGGGIACFSTAARNELKIGHRKIVGSAQRKSGDRILQHGSILCGPHHKKITDYLLLDSEQKKQIEDELNNSTTDINALTGEVNYENLKNALVEGMKTYYNSDFSVIAEEDVLSGKLKESFV